MTGYSEVTNAVAAMASIQSCKRKKTKIVFSASFLNIPFNESQATKLCRFLFIKMPFLGSILDSAKIQS